MNKDELMKTAKAMVAPGKGILAADESSGTIKKRFDSILVESTEENRRFYRELLFTTPGMEEFISGVILYDETIRQKSKDGTSLPDVLVKKGVLPGIKVDKGAKMLAGSDQEKVTEGLDGLRERFIVNAHALARFAALSQEANIVPIVEPEVLMDADNTIEICEQVTEKTLLAVFDELKKQRVFIEGIILKPNMVISGKKCSTQATSKQIAESTLRCFKKVLPKELPGVVFLSGGQSEVEATVNLNEMNKTAPHPWELSFSYGRALQQSALKTWSGKPENAKAAQDAFFKRAKFNGLARLGNYKSEMEKLNH